MPKVKVTGVTVAYVWDDDSKSETTVCCGRFDNTGPYVSVKEDSGETIYLRPESWPEIRDQIQEMFDAMEREDS